MASNTYLDKSGLTYFWSKIKAKDDGLDTKIGTKRIYYGTSDTAANTNAKVATTVDGNFKLETGAVVFVGFTYKCAGSPATLNVDNTGAQPIATIMASTGTYNIWDKNEVVGFAYDGTRFVCFGRKTASTSNYGLAFYTTSATEDIEYTAATPKSINQLAQNMLSGVEVYSTSSTYAVGDKCRRGYNIYKCTTAITTAESWNASHWTALESFQTQIDNINTSIGNVETILQTLNSGSGV